MPKTLAIKNALDDSMLRLGVTDFSGGLNSEGDPHDLDLNTSPDCQNVKITRDGRLIGRFGWVERVASLPAAPDGLAFFYDSAGNRRLALWADGNLYEVSNFTLVAIASSIYAAGQRIAWTTLNGILYFSDGVTISGASGVYYWDPASPANGYLASSGTPGTIAAPACKVMTTYAGSLVLGNLTYHGSGITANDTFIWSNVNDPTTIVGTNLQRVGAGAGGHINCMLPLAVANVGVSPFKTILVGKSEFGIYAYSGALGQLAEIIVNCPTGVRDGETLRYIPGPDGSGYACFLGTDNKVWAVNGTQAVEISNNIRTELGEAIETSLADSPYQRITSVINTKDFQYVLDIGRNIHYVYHYDKKAWTRYSGWPSGHWTEARNSAGAYNLYCADRTALTMKEANLSLKDGSASILPYWKTPFIHAGDSEMLKTWKWIYAAFRTNNGNVTVQATANLDSGVTTTKTMTPASVLNGAALWDAAVWDTALWGAGGTSYGIYKKKARLSVSTSGLDGSAESLRGYDVTIKLSTTADQYWEMLGFSLLYLPGGRKRVANS